MVNHEQHFIDPVIGLCLYNLVYKLEEEIQNEIMQNASRNSMKDTLTNILFREIVWRN